HQSAASVCLRAPWSDVWLLDHRSVAREAVLDPECAAVLPELQVSLRDRLAQVEDAHQVVEEFARFGLRVSADQASSVHSDTLTGAELQHEAVTGEPGNDARRLEILEI